MGRQTVTTRPLQAVDRALRLIDLLADGSPRLGVSDLARKTGWSKAVVFRLLRTLEAHGYVLQDEARRYQMGTKPLQLAGAVLRRLGLPQVARPAMLALSERTGESVVLTVPTPGGIICLDTVDSPQQLRATFRVGRVIPWHAGAAGKLHLAYLMPKRARAILAGRLPRYTERTVTDPARLREELRRIRRQGYAFTVGELDPGVAAISVPVLDWRGEMVAAISLGGPAPRFAEDRLPGLLKEVRRAATSISRLLGGQSPAPAVRRRSS
ncbi:MAG: IclR family transcriptional regulator [Armatimonadota bacterium]|nr:IclR family transcriptional regulator [Armatimonadota bacterium]MDR7452460.1 IclR family transcriptional regulator [Armatimonadota bacterium]MDR7466198.1 IclR family transcriptional regulator [Armatimonadota bacterium]MDR7495119.1 IclR family transcriptional regulator [Armatimonadota bacterium]MDR7500538.1 IclR family transcriptional regulator [Armatimonadota bacterium]